VPTKLDGTHRGFGFVEFTSVREATAALEALRSTHLYGRHLVIEVAEDDEGVEAVRERTRKGFHDDDGPEKKKGKVVLGEAIGSVEDFEE
jgi:multiple RNA-binding domain-containing protein 1